MPPEAFFSGPGLDRADALRGVPDRLAELSSRDDARQLVWRDGVPALDEEGRLQWTNLSDPLLFLGLDGISPRFSPIAEPAPMAFTVLPLIAQLNAVDAPVFAVALSLSRWHARHRFCANCGQLGEIIRGGWARRCPNCGAEHFPRVDPVVIMLVERGDSVLLGRQPHYPVGRYSALAGFVEVGESIEDAVIREVMEEAGILARDVQYIASQPWPFPSSLMLGCLARTDQHHLTIDTTELEDARWFTRAEVRLAIAEREDAVFQPPPRAAIARTLLEHWLDA